MGDFTVNVPPPELHDACTECGTVSGRDLNKFARADLTAVAARWVANPIVEECVLHYECRVVHKNNVDLSTLSQDIIAGAYASGDFHHSCFGEILGVYAALDLAQPTARVRL